MPYVYDNAWDQEIARLRGIEAMYDGASHAAIEATGIRPGWRCLEVGGGGGAIAEWLAGFVTPGGRVTATDLDTRFLDAIDHPALEVRHHDIVADELEENAYDLIHSRLLMEHLPSRDVVLKKMISALKPGGWIVIEDYDLAAANALDGPLPCHPPELEPLFRKMNGVVTAFMTANGYDATYGRMLGPILIGAGLDDVRVTVYATLVYGGSAESEFFRLTTLQLADAIAATGAMTKDEIERLSALLENPEAAWMSVPLFSAAGRKPA